MQAFLSLFYAKRIANVRFTFYLALSSNKMRKNPQKTCAVHIFGLQ